MGMEQAAKTLTQIRLKALQRQGKSLPDEEVRINEGRLEINGAVIQEPHMNGVSDGAVATHEWWPGTDEYVLLGDNRAASTDSRKFGTVPLGAFKGKVLNRSKGR